MYAINDPTLLEAANEATIEMKARRRDPQLLNRKYRQCHD